MILEVVRKPFLTEKIIGHIEINQDGLNELTQDELGEITMKYDCGCIYCQEKICKSVGFCQPIEFWFYLLSKDNKLNKFNEDVYIRKEI